MYVKNIMLNMDTIIISLWIISGKKKIHYIWDRGTRAPIIGHFTNRMIDAPYKVICIISHALDI